MAKSTAIHLRATVKAIVPLTDFSGQATLVDFAPRFALTLRVRTVNPVIDEFASGSDVTFAIHSPALLFEGDPAKDLLYDFYLLREIKDGKVRFFDLSTRKGTRKMTTRATH